MRITRAWAAALALMTLGSAATRGEGGAAQDASNADFQSPVGAMTNEVDPASYGALGGGLPMLNRNCGQFVVGGEYLYVRALPSESVAFVEQTTNPARDVFRQFDYDFESNFRAYAGYRLCDCGEEIRFTFSNLGSSAEADSGAVQTGSNTVFLGPLDIPALLPGERLTGTSDVDLNNYDLGWSKTIPLGCPMDDCCGCGDTCCGDSCDSCADTCGGCGDGCGGCGCYCPAWDITYTGALRFADYSANRDFTAFSANGARREIGSSTVDFDGVGGRFGLMGRRYLGRQGRASLYLKGDVSLLVGDVTVSNITTNDPDGNLPLSSGQSISCTHVIPVTEIEAGGTVFLTCRTSLSAGYFIAAWHDLGFREDYNFGLPTQYDDANIMGFDGMFVRVETTF